jgi:hypothetical protein
VRLAGAVSAPTTSQLATLIEMFSIRLASDHCPICRCYHLQHSVSIAVTFHMKYQLLSTRVFVLVH